MKSETSALIQKLTEEHSLSRDEYEQLIVNRDGEAQKVLAENAVAVRKKIYGTDVFIRGLIEFTNICKNNCFYCGIRAGNSNCDRYRLSEEEILACTDEGWDLGYRTFVLQGGEDPFFTDDILCSLVQKIKARHPDCAITLSIGERTKESYRRLF